MTPDRKGASSSFDLAVVLPLGVAANQLMKIESDLRFLTAKVARYGQEPDGTRREAAAKLELMSETLEAISRLMADIRADLQPSSDARDFRDERDD